MLVPDSLLQNRYRILRLLSQGGMGAVYESVDEHVEHIVAVKQTLFSDRTMRSQFEREAKLLASLRHPTLPRVTDFFFEGSGQFLVMEFIPGDDLKTSLEHRKRAFSEDEVLGWAEQLLDALEYLHTRNPPVIHRDIKPQNLKVNEEGQIVLLDFGLAKGTPLNMTHLQPGNSLLGCTREYAPPEQVLRVDSNSRSLAAAFISPEELKEYVELPSDARTDLYSLGATLFHLLTNIIPPLAVERMINISQGRADPLRNVNDLNSNVNPFVSAVISQAMALRRGNRHSTASEMAEALLYPITISIDEIVNTPFISRNDEAIVRKPLLDDAAPIKESQRKQSAEEEEQHAYARRFARLLASEIKLYNEQKVVQGRRNNDLYEQLKEDIDRSLKVYEKKVAAKVAAKSDYFYDALVDIVADGDPVRLGPHFLRDGKAKITHEPQSTTLWRPRILLADDSITIQKVVKLNFADEDLRRKLLPPYWPAIEVVAVSNGEVAENRLSEIRPDLVLADIFMPGANGYALCEFIKQSAEFSNTPVVLLVGAFEPFDEAEARRVRADAHLTKPFESRTLTETVARLIQRTLIADQIHH